MLAYHASNTKFDKFSLNRANTRKIKEKFKALWFSTDIEYVKEFGKILYTVDIDTKNFLKETQYRKIDKLCKEFGLDEEEDEVCGIGILETDRGQEFADFLVSKGIDGYMFKQHNGYTLIIFNPECVTIKDKDKNIIEENYFSSYSYDYNYASLNKILEKYL